MAGGDNGMTCSVLVFIRSAGMVRVSLSQSTSLQTACMTSSVRSTVKAKKRRQYLDAHPYFESLIWAR